MKLTTLRPRIAAAPLRMSRMTLPAPVDRLRGRAAVERRARWLALHPLCCMCDGEGRAEAAREVDHVVPLWKGGADDETNLQSLCTPHHAAKTAAEAVERAAGWPVGGEGGSFWGG